MHTLLAPALLARDATEAIALAAPFLSRNEAVVAKILSPDIVHKPEVGGVRLNLTNAHSVGEAVNDILSRARAARPDAHVRGVTIHPMIVKPKAQVLRENAAMLAMSAELGFHAAPDKDDSGIIDVSLQLIAVRQSRILAKRFAALARTGSAIGFNTVMT